MKKIALVVVLLGSLSICGNGETVFFQQQPDVESAFNNIRRDGNIASLQSRVTALEAEIVALKSELTVVHEQFTQAKLNMEHTIYVINKANIDRMDREKKEEEKFARLAKRAAKLKLQSDNNLPASLPTSQNHAP